MTAYQGYMFAPSSRDWIPHTVVSAGQSRYNPEGEFLQHYFDLDPSGRCDFLGWRHVVSLACRRPPSEARLRSSSAQRGFAKLARRFRTLVWGALFLLVMTGSVLLGNVMNISVPLSSWPPIVITKLTLVLMLVVVSLTHDRIIGPKVRTLKHKNASELSTGEHFLLRLSPLLGRLTLLLGLGVLFAAVFMVRS